MPKRTHEHTNLHYEQLRIPAGEPGHRKSDEQLMKELAERGASLYHPRPAEVPQRLGQMSLVDYEHPERGWKMSLVDGVPIPVEKPMPPDLAA